jgi:hypothetical protein
MVNTFITTGAADRDFSQSAVRLDNRRLNKQITEAKQILRLCDDLHLVAEVCQWPPCPSNPLLRPHWASTIATSYNALSHKLTFINNQMIWDHDRKTVYKATKYQTVADGIVINGKLYRRDQVCFHELGERQVSFGYVNHPAARMWVGYETALRVYINSHVTEWHARGYKSHTHIGPVTPFVVPWWRSYDILHISHQASLLRKANEHYRNFFQLSLEQQALGYWWPSANMPPVQ